MSEEVLFRRRLIHFFRFFVKKAARRNRMNWGCIRRSEKHFSRELTRNPGFADLHTEFVFSLFEKFPCQDKQLIKHWFDKYSRPRFDSDDEEKFFTLLKLRRDKRPKIIEMMDKLLNFTILMDTTATKRILRYKIIDSRPKINILLLRNFLFTAISCIVPTNVRHKIKRPTPSLRQLGCIHRTNLISWCIVAIIPNRESSWAGSFTESIKFLFKALSEPFINVGEVKRVIEWGLEEDVECFRSDIERFCDTFVSIFPQSSKPLQPRSLKHLSRCRVRSCLKKAEELPHGVWRLNIPRQLANYVLMQDSIKDFYPKHGYPFERIPFRLVS